MNCLIIEDDKQNLEKVAGYIGRCTELTLAAACSSLPEAEEALRRNQVDLLFLDVELQGGSSGLDFYNDLKNKPLVVIMTSHPKYAVDSYAAHLTGFLPKPFGFNQFCEIVDYVLEMYKKQKRTAHIEHFDAQVGNYIPIVERGEVIDKVYYRDIVYFEQCENNVTIGTTDGKTTMLYRRRIGEVEAVLPATVFQRINKSVIISVAHIKNQFLDTIEVGGRSFQITSKFKRKE